jgi:SAM-dependent methyltransferase
VLKVALEGWIDVRHSTAIGGWASDTGSETPLTLELVDSEDSVLCTATANAFRDELLGRPEAVAARAFWFQPLEPLSAPQEARVRVAGTNDYLPDRPEPISIPDNDLIFDVVGGRNIIPQFLAAGAANQQFLQKLVLETKGPLQKGARVLDWGCGCGRVARHWAAQASEIEFYGCDIHGAAMAWCAENLPFGNYRTTELLPPLPYPDNFFDLIYATSVLTHLLFQTHYLWMAEIWRILKPGGIAILTAQGPSVAPIVLSEISRHGFKSEVHGVDDGMFVGLDLGEGANSTGNIVTRDVMEKIFSPFELATYRPCFGLMGIQDTYVFAKRSASKAVLVPSLAEQALVSTETRIDVQLPSEPFRNCSVLAAAPGLIDPATIELVLEFQGSTMPPLSTGRLRLQEKSAWTNLKAAYSFASLGPIPPHDGELKLAAICRSEKPMDGAVLQLHNAVFW